MNIKVILILLGASALIGIYYLLTNKIVSPNQIACTLEAKICPDGTSVGRFPPNCEFAPCPTDNSDGGGIMGEVFLGPSCPVIKDPPEGECESEPFATTLIVTTVDGARVIKEFSSDDEGKFSVSVPPGEYSISSAAASNILPYCSSEAIVVTKGYTTAIVNCDTGIR